MTKSQILAAVAGCVLVLCLAVSTIPAQQRPTAPPTTSYQRPAQGIALLDVNRIFKEHSRFKSMIAEMKATAEQIDGQLKAERDRIRNLNEQLKEFSAGTAQYKQMEQEIVRRTADLNAQVQLQRKDMLLRESEIYHTVYKEVQQEVAYYANSAGIAAVIQFNGDAVDPSDPESVLRDINNPMVWHSPAVDITPVISQRLQQRAGSPDMTTRPGIPPQR